MLTRTLTVDEVNAIVPELEAIFARIRALDREIGARANELERMGFGAGLSTAASEPAEVTERRRITQTRVDEYHQQLHKIEELGGFVEDLDLGFVVFASRVEDRNVELCWQIGDSKVAYSRDPGADWTRRRRLR